MERNGTFRGHFGFILDGWRNTVSFVILGELIARPCSGHYGTMRSPWFAIGACSSILGLMDGVHHLCFGQR